MVCLLPHCWSYAGLINEITNHCFANPDEIAEYRTQLNDLLWEFDDFIDDADSFDADKFTELQAMSRKAAPKIYDILMRMKLETPYDDLSPVGSLPLSIGTQQQSPALRHSTAFFTPLDQNQQAASSSPANEPRPDSGIYTIEDATSQLKRLMGFEDGFEERPPMQPSPPRQPPPIPNTNPWDVNIMPPVDETKQATDPELERRPEVPRDGAESPIDPGFSPIITPSDIHHRQSITPAQPETLDPIANGTEVSTNENDDRSHLPSSANYPTSPSRRYNPFPPPARPRTVSRTSQVASAIPEDSVIDGTGGLSLQQPPPSAVGLHEPTPSTPQAPGPSYVATSNFAGFENSHRPAIINHHTQLSTSETVASSQLSPRSRPVQDESEGLQVAPNSIRDDQELPIPVEMDLKEERTNSASQPSSIDCSITPQSSFWMAKGFCEGAKEVSRGGIGVKKTKKPVSCSPLSLELVL
jgi:hypothetical protein